MIIVIRLHIIKFILIDGDIKVATLVNELMEIRFSRAINKLWPLLKRVAIITKVSRRPLLS